MRFILDSGGLIKLNRAGVLRQVVESVACMVPSVVFDEVVLQGKANRYSDAEAIEAGLAERVEIVDVEATQGMGPPGLGAGERSILALLSRTVDPHVIVLSDDRRFLSVLAADGIPFLTPADMLVILVGRRILTREDVRTALDRLKPLIRSATYWAALASLTNEGGRGGED